MVDASKWSLAIAAEYVKRAPAKHGRTGSPIGIKKPTAIVDEHLPAHWWHVGGGPASVEAGQRLRPSPGTHMPKCL
jgi:hypothetical protein